MIKIKIEAQVKEYHNTFSRGSSGIVTRAGSIGITGEAVLAARSFSTGVGLTTRGAREQPHPTPW